MEQAPSPAVTPTLTEPEERAWLGLLTVVAQALPEVERTTRAHGLVYIEYLLLAELAASPEGRPMNELAHCVQASPSRLSHRIRKLVDHGYVEQRTGQSDARVSIARITQRGRAVVDEIGPAVLRDVRRLVLDPLQPQQVEALADALSAISNRLGAS